MGHSIRLFFNIGLVGVGLWFSSMVYGVPPACCPPPSNVDRIREKGVLVVGTLKDDFPPYIMRSKKGVTGIEIRLAQYFADALGVRLEIRRTAQHNDQIVDQVAQGYIDMGISTISITVPRAFKVNFSAPYMYFQKGIILNRLRFNRLRKKDTETLRQFYSRGYKIGVQRGSAYTVFAQSLFPKAEVIAYDTWGEVIQDLNKGVIEGAMNDNFEILKTMWSSSQGLLTYLPIILTEGSDPIAIALPRNDPHFLNWVNTLLKVDKIHYDLKTVQTEYERYLKEEDVP